MRFNSKIQLVFFIIAACVLSQENASLPPPCPLSTFNPGDVSPSFTFALTSGGNLSIPATDNTLLPLILFIVDDATDPGGVILAEDGIEIDRFLAQVIPESGTFAFLSQSVSDGAAQIQSLFEIRLAKMSPKRAAAWRARLVFARDSVDSIISTGSAAGLGNLTKAWTNPRLFINAANIAPIPRVDGFYECFQWPPAIANYTLIGPIIACSENLPPTIPQGSLLLITGVSPVGGVCDAEAVISWAQRRAPTAAGAVIATQSPTLVGRACDDTFVDAPFFPLIISIEGGEALSRIVIDGNGSASISLNWTCGNATWLAIDNAGKLQQIGWRKYTEMGALRWARDEQYYLSAAAAVAERRPISDRISLIPKGAQLNNFAKNITFDPHVLRQSGSGAVFDFSLTCTGVGDNECGPWDRIISASAMCWPQNMPPPVTTQLLPTEIARWITPFRRNSGRWQSPADVLIGLVGNGSQTNTELWTCEITSSTCCEPWYGELTLLLSDGTNANASSSSSSSLAAFVTIPIIFPNMASHFGPDFNTNRTTTLLPPVNKWTRAVLTALITGHGSAPPPPVSQGCEYSPTEHSFAIGIPGGAQPILIVNSSDSPISRAQYMGAGSEEGCANQVGVIDSDGIGFYGAIGNQHGDYRDGRDGWCPGQGVRALRWDVSNAISHDDGIAIEITYSALSFYVDGTHPSYDGCGGDIIFSAALLFY